MPPRLTRLLRLPARLRARRLLRLPSLAPGAHVERHAHAHAHDVEIEVEVQHLVDLVQDLHAGHAAYTEPVRGLSHAAAVGTCVATVATMRTEPLALLLSYKHLSTSAGYGSAFLNTLLCSVDIGRDPPGTCPAQAGSAPGTPRCPLDALGKEYGGTG